MIESLHLKDVGPADEMSIAFRPRMNFITGDNGLGKSFLLDVAWWALTGTWARGVVIPRPLPAKAQIHATRMPQSGGWMGRRDGYDWQTEVWSPNKGPTEYPDLVLYARVDGGISTCEPARSYQRTHHDDKRHVFHFDAHTVWHGSEASEGLIRDWASWQRENGEAFHQLEAVLDSLSPSDQHPLRAGDLRRLSISDPKQYPTLAMPNGEDVPVIHASAGMRRVIALAYVLVWTWREHLEACRILNKRPVRQITFLVDEIESHLHPQWQRRIVPALLDVMTALTRDSGISVQLVAVTHSPLVLASTEPHFDPHRDAIFTLDLVDNRVTLEEFPWSRQGDADAWLTSPIFDLKIPRSVEAETALLRAKALLIEAAPDPTEIAEVDDLLKAALSSTDRFWVRWSAWREEHLQSTGAEP